MYKPSTKVEKQSLIFAFLSDPPKSKEVTVPIPNF